jgi:hypothetical protein
MRGDKKSSEGTIAEVAAIVLPVRASYQATELLRHMDFLPIFRLIATVLDLISGKKSK